MKNMDQRRQRVSDLKDIDYQGFYLAWIEGKEVYKPSNIVYDIMTEVLNYEPYGIHTDRKKRNIVARNVGVVSKRLMDLGIINKDKKRYVIDKKKLKRWLKDNE